MHLDNPVVTAHSKRLRLLKAEYLHLCAAALIFVVLILLLPRDLPWQLRATVGITGTAIWLWVFEPIPMPLTALLVVAGLPVTGAVPFETALQGFSNGSVFLIMAGFMMARGVNSTALGKRLAYFTMVSFGGSVRGVLWGVLLAPQVLSLFIPATAVRTTLLLPAVMALLGALNLNKSSNTSKLMVLGLACGASISGIGFLPAAIANVLTADLLRTSLNMPIYYFQWLKITWPVWLLMLPLTWLVLLRVFPPEVSALDIGELRKELSNLGALDGKEKKCLIILALTVSMWMTESLHGLPTAVPALLAVLVMALPGLGITDWEQLKGIDWGTVLLMGATLTLAVAINKTGVASFIAGKFTAIPHLQNWMAVPILAVLVLALFTQVYHLGVSNVSTVVVTLIPVVLEITQRLGMNPLLAAMTINISALFGFLLVVESLPNVITYSTGVYTSRDMLKVGIWLTFVSIAVVCLVAVTWWPLIGVK